MKILYTLTAYPPSTGGAQIHQHRLAQEMSQRHDIQVVTHWDNNRTDWLLGTTILAPGEDKDYQIDGVRVHGLGMCLCEKVAMLPFVIGYYPAMMLGMSWVIRPIAAIIERHLRAFTGMVDLVHHVRIGREGLSYASYKTARQNDIPFVLTPVHHPRWVGRRYRAFNTLYSLADAVLVLTTAEKEILVDLGVKEERIHVIGHGPVLEQDADGGKFLIDHHINGPMVLFLGQHYPYKGYRQLLEAAKSVWERNPEVHFVFIGPAVEKSEEVFGEIRDKRVHRLGHVSLQEKTNALAACTLLCVPSTQESFGGVYAEAWCFEKPVMGCNIPAVAEVIRDGVDGFLVLQDRDDIAEKIIYLLENEVVAMAMGSAGKRKVAELYDWPKIAGRVERVYQALTRG